MADDIIELGIIGAGAAGLMAAIVARRRKPELRVVVFEGRAKPGAKILVSGGGRCNVTNRVVKPADFHGDRKLIARVLRRFDVGSTIAFFESIGVELKHEPEFDKLFPVSDSAHTVLDALLGECLRLGVELRAPFRVATISRDGHFVLVGDDGTIARCARVLLATGGCSLPKSGSDGAGYAFATALGHTVTATAPALVPLVLLPHLFHDLSGVSFRGEIQVWSGGRKTAEVEGPVLITHFGLSGPAALDVSRHWSTCADTPPELRLNFFPGETPEAVAARWIESARRSSRPVVGPLLARLPERLARALLERVRIPPSMPLAAFDRERRKSLLGVATAFTLPVAATRGWNEAEVTAGGVPLAEVDPATMASRHCPGLYLVGEILDVDGRLGGFNFQWAWASGFVAGEAQ